MDGIALEHASGDLAGGVEAIEPALVAVDMGAPRRLTEKGHRRSATRGRGANRSLYIFARGYVWRKESTNICAGCVVKDHSDTAGIVGAIPIRNHRLKVELIARSARNLGGHIEPDPGDIGGDVSRPALCSRVGIARRNAFGLIARGVGVFAVPVLDQVVAGAREAVRIGCGGGGVVGCGLGGVGRGLGR